MAGKYSALYSPESSSEPTPASKNHETLRFKNPLENNSGSCILLSISQLERLFKNFLDRHHDVELCSFLHSPTQDVKALSSKSQLLVIVISLSPPCISPMTRQKKTSGLNLPLLCRIIMPKLLDLARNSSDEPSSMLLINTESTKSLLIAIRHQFTTFRGIWSWLFENS